MTDDMVIIHEYNVFEMPKRRLLDLFSKGASLYRVCENPECDAFEKYSPITSDQDLMTYCMKCGRKVLRYGVEKTAGS